MPLGPIGNNSYLTEADVRIWLRDADPEANVLIDDVEFTSEEIRTALTLAVDYWNETPPLIGRYDYDKFPNRFHLLQGTAANLLFMAAHRYRRNHLNYTAGGVSVDDQNKYQQYDVAGARLWDEYKRWVADTKKASNAAAGWGSV